jgi:glutamate carboxypeptidase
LQSVLPELFSRVTWVVLLNAAEESLVPDFGQRVVEQLSGNTLAALVFEGGERAGGPEAPYRLVTARKGMARFHVRVEGKGAHAGASHEKGANAILQMADVVRLIAGFTDYDRQITFNVGTISGGTVINRVPHEASAFVEMRAYLPEVFEEGVRKVLALSDYSTVRSANGGYGCRVSVEVLGEWEPWAPNEGTNALWETWHRAGQALERPVMHEKRGGLSDGNWTWRLIPTLDGLGPEGGNAHCSQSSEDGAKDQEYVLPEQFVPKALLNFVAIRTLLEEYFVSLVSRQEAILEQI